MITAALGDVAEFVNGFAFKPDDWHEDGTAIVRIQNLTDVTKPFNRTRRQLPERFKVQRGDLLVSWSATLGVFIWDSTDPAFVNQHIFKVVPQASRIDSGFLRHMLASAIRSMERHLHGATMKHINRAEFLATEIPLPALANQRRIAAILDQGERIQVKTLRAIHLLEDLSQSIFNDMFGQWLGTSTKLPSRPLAEWIDPMRPITYGILKPGIDVADGIPYVRVTDIQRGKIEVSSLRRTTEAIASEYQRSRLLPGDLLISIRGHVGRLAFVPLELEGANITQDSARLAVVDSDTAVFLRAAIESPGAQSWMARRTKGAAVRGINLGDLRELPIPLPSTSDISRFAEIHRQLELTSELANALVVPTFELFTSLQNRAFEGAL
ncbi:MAG: restriction endonuclease subunit S [Actinomycetota bacterium]|nr:restriction endonuclease subunit S [Actinomycetota bacterium]